jgi:CubicO group peptidase (beta-lactamase class C family)
MKFHRTPGVSIAVINEGKLEWARGYGVRTAGSEQAVTTDTMFQAASISKPLTAVAVLRLVEQGKLSLDDDVNKHLTTWKVPAGDATMNEGRTIRRVLSHTAGFTVSGFLGYTSGRPLPSLPQILDGKPPANTPPIRVDIAPGTKFRYSGGGYIVLQQLLIDVTKTSFPELMQPIFRTVRMTHSSFESPAPTANVASGHMPDTTVLEGGWRSHPELAAAGLWTTPTDLAQFVVELQQSANGKSKRLLSPNTTTLMLTPLL